MHAMVNRCINTGLKLNPDKCFVKQQKIKFYGVICGQGGVQPDPGKVSALKQLSSPSNCQELQTFLKLANYMGPFMPNLSTLTTPLRTLLKKDNCFKWYAAHQESFNKIQDSISNEITLTYFDPTKETILQVDASMKGLSAALTQDRKPIAFASKALTDFEARYANIDRGFACGFLRLQEIPHLPVRPKLYRPQRPQAPRKHPPETPDSYFPASSADAAKIAAI